VQNCKGREITNKEIKVQKIRTKNLEHKITLIAKCIVSSQLSQMTCSMIMDLFIALGHRQCIEGKLHALKWENKEFHNSQEADSKNARFGVKTDGMKSRLCTFQPLHA